jgi:hypothetical protein
MVDHACRLVCSILATAHREIDREGHSLNNNGSLVISKMTAAPKTGLLGVQ